jgi:hypothetical protein
VPAVPVLPQVQPCPVRGHQLLLHLQLQPRRQVQRRAAEMWVRRMRWRQLAGRERIDTHDPSVMSQ